MFFDTISSRTLMRTVADLISHEADLPDNTPLDFASRYWAQRAMAAGVEREGRRPFSESMAQAFQGDRVQLLIGYDRLMSMPITAEMRYMPAILVGITSHLSASGLALLQADLEKGDGDGFVEIIRLITEEGAKKVGPAAWENMIAEAREELR